MTIYELKNMHLEKHPESHFFDRDTLKFFGEALSRMRVLKKTVTITDSFGDEHECYVVSATRTKNWNGSCKPYTHYYYFDVDTLTALARASGKAIIKVADDGSETLYSYSTPIIRRNAEGGACEALGWLDSHDRQTYQSFLWA